MKSINPYVEDDEFKKLKAKKDRLGLTWREFVLKLLEVEVDDS